ncbi:DUF6171 family protein [Paenibacillus pasadenensis]|uniref:Uncharacterized protein n=2 Tax=Paenibacillus TaxID=44249 RepID=A0A2N5N641_9BACL|nr:MULTISPECIES: DUF6171 family protein [Paenibacillus]PLT45824.1 hypothetical protein B8V81_4255 [Paenibacillus pasadenensis]QGG56255.1 hypothetical protein GE073_12145 [Paenibacillus sp. B01]
MADTDCKGCREGYRVTEAQMQRLLATSAFAPDKRVEAATYERRLEACRSCAKLEDGVTCRACGCIMPVVAWLRARECPLPGQRRWASEP